MKKNKYSIFIILIFIFHLNFTSSYGNPENKKTILITGGAGFIGSHFLEYMYDNHADYNFIVLDALTYAGSLDNLHENIRKSDRLNFFHGSITNVQLVNELMSKSDWVVHFAAETHVTKSILNDHIFLTTNVLGTQVLMQALLKNKDKVQKFIHISSSEVYGTAEYQPMDENHPLKPRSPYAAAKLSGEALVYSYFCTFDVPVVIIRPFNNYGPRQHLEKLIPSLIYSAMNNQPLTIQGEGLQSRDWIHVLDLCKGLDKVIHVNNFSKIKGETINLGSGKTTSILDIAKMVLKFFDLPKDFLIFTHDRPGQVKCHIAANKKAEILLGWTPSIELEDGLRMTIDWYLKNPNRLEEMRQDMLIEIGSDN